jgi:CubicO group peptidase (beta-lactamase class C family)/beta-glucosidase-like glycosyl hydrolase
MIKKVLGCCLLFLIIWEYPVQAQAQKDKWIDSVFNQMSIGDKLGQIFMIHVSAEQNSADLNNLQEKIKDDKFGGILFTPGKTINQANLTNRLQSVSKIPLLVGFDGTSGIGIPGDTTLSFPAALTQGAIGDDSLNYFLAREIGRQMKLMGIHINFVPANLSTDPGNETNSTFGENRFSVASKSLAYLRGLQSQGLMACAKYFPLQGESVATVQKNLPTVQLTADSLRAFSFKVLVRNQLPALMAASTDLPMFFERKKSKLSNLFSNNAIQYSFERTWFKQNLNFDGLIFLDVEKMEKSSPKFAPGEAELFSIEAGNDMLITTSNAGAIIRKMRKILRKQKELLPLIDQHVKRILAIKYDAGLVKKIPIDIPSLPGNLVTIEGKLLQQKIYRSAVTILQNQRNTLPVQSLEDKKFTCIIADDSINGNFLSAMLSKYVQITKIQTNEKKDTIQLSDPTVYQQQVFIVALFPETKEQTILKLLPVLKEPRINREIIICDFGSVFFRPYASDFSTVITAYEASREMLQIVPQVIFGGYDARGVSPIVYGQIPSGKTTKTKTLDRLTYSFPEDAGMDAKTLDKIDVIAKEAIEIRATPGCYVLVAKDGKVIYEKSFGYLTYEKLEPVTDETIYDLASLTKVSATLQTVMFMHEKGLIDINKKASVYLPELKTSNKKDFILKDILTHQAGLRPFIPFYAFTLKDSLPMAEYYSTTLSAQYPYVVADNLFANATMKDSLWTWVLRGNLREKPARTPFDYVYSDMGFYMLQHLAEKILNQPIEDFLTQNLYEPLGSYTTGYLPLLRFPIRQIAPTENDKIFRKALLIGTVHDPGAAMHGGIAGHAGLFSTANDLAKVYQMLLQEGHYGGIQYYRPETVRLFAQKQYQNSRRGLGWDKPTGDWKGSTGLLPSPKTFGHTGYTGTCVWVDPEFKLVYIFLSNRVHPVVTNKLLNANIRSRIQDVIYQSIFDYCKTAGSQPGIDQAAQDEIIGRSQNK